MNRIVSKVFLLVATFLFSYPLLGKAADLELPVRGRWIVMQGPPCGPVWGNHCNTRNSQFALDVTPFQASCIGMPIFAPSSGEIIEVLDGIPNGVHGGHDAGNHVVIRRSNIEFIALAHFSPGSITVRRGQAVTAGQPIGACGASGNAPGGPHLHFHMQATPNILDYMGAPGLPMIFARADVWNPMMQRCERVSNYALRHRDALC
jgi:hypothetical protein